MVKPRIFVSSTYYDLKQIRDNLDSFIENIGYEAVLSDKGKIPYNHNRPLDESCYSEITSCHMLILIIGGRYGSPSSESRKENADEICQMYKSVTMKEYQTARDKDIPIFIFVEKNVYSEYRTYYKKNLDNPAKINYVYVDSINVFKLLDEINSQTRNNPIKEFNKFEDISKWLKEQWAGLFAEHLQEQHEQKMMAYRSHLNKPPCMELNDCNDGNSYGVWRTWQENAIKIRNVLKGPVTDLHFNPNAVLCISHGSLNGLFTGSLVAHGLFPRTKVLSLWGVRDGQENMFNNEVNRQMLQALKSEVGRKKITLLLIDYKIETGRTASQAIKFVTGELGSHTDIVLCPLFCISKENIDDNETILDKKNRKILRDFLPFNYRNEVGKGLNIEEDDFYDIVCVGEKIPKHPFYFN